MISRARRAFGKLVAKLASLDSQLVVARVPRRYQSYGEQFCDYCGCADCRTGESGTVRERFECEDTSHICDVCYGIEPCLDVIAPSGHGWSMFCKDHPQCVHKPVLKKERTRWS